MNKIIFIANQIKKPELQYLPAIAGDDEYQVCDSEHETWYPDYRNYYT
jgi:hypothetical protein